MSATPETLALAKMKAMADAQRILEEQYREAECRYKAGTSKLAGVQSTKQSPRKSGGGGGHVIGGIDRTMSAPSGYGEDTTAPDGDIFASLSLGGGSQQRPKRASSSITVTPTGHPNIHSANHQHTDSNDPMPVSPSDFEGLLNLVPSPPPESLEILANRLEHSIKAEGDYHHHHQHQPPSSDLPVSPSKLIIPETTENSKYDFNFDLPLGPDDLFVSQMQPQHPIKQPTSTVDLPADTCGGTGELYSNEEFHEYLGSWCV
jgi:hypothetical protein